MKVTGVGFEADIKTAVTPIPMNIMNLQKSLTELQTAVFTQAPSPSSTAIFAQADPYFISFMSYFKLIGFLAADMLKLSADSTLTFSKVFDMLTADTGALVKFIADYKIEMSQEKDTRKKATLLSLHPKN